MFIKKDDNGCIVGCSIFIPEIEDKVINGAMTYKFESGWIKSEDQEALDEFIKNGPPKTEAQLDNEDRIYYQQFVDPILIKAIYAKADELGLDLSEAVALKAARKAKRSK